MEAAFGGSTEMLLTLPSTPLSLDPCGPRQAGACPPPLQASPGPEGLLD